MAAEFEEIAARGADRPGNPALAGVEAVRTPQRHVAVDGARVDQGVAAGERHVAIDLPLIAEDVAAGQSDVAGDQTEIVERVPHPPRRSTAPSIWPLLDSNPIEASGPAL